jgi:hypothetical protein
MLKGEVARIGDEMENLRGEEGEDKEAREWYGLSGLGGL